MESVSNLTETIQVHVEYPPAEAALRISEFELMKAVRVWRVEKGPVRRLLLRRAIGCTAAEKKQ
jgi:hypothetical protein